ncbi:MAG: beta-ketoacyl-[acyl-carrier-protein] synthase family protein [Archangium sp.]
MSEPVLITGLGAVSSLGLGIDAMWSALAAGRDGMAPIERFSTSEFTTHLGGMVPIAESLKADDADGMQRLVIRFAVEAGREALRRSGIRITSPRRVALVLGTSMGSHLGGLHETSAKVARELGIEGPVITISTACASSTNALGTGRDLLDDGTADVVLAGGSDVLCPEIFAGFHALGLLSATKCAPFSESMGTTLGEGAGFLVLERESDARARSAPTVACLSGYALSADGYHATSPEPSGAGVARALRGTLEDAGLTAEQIGYVNAHGTGTAANDPSEWTAISSVLGARASSVPVSSTKSYLAHAQGAAGVLELIATLVAWEHGAVPPTLHLEKPRKRSPVDAVAQSTPRAHAYEHALATNSAFGGANAAVGVSRASLRRREPRVREVWVSGVGVLGPFGQTVEALAAWKGGSARLAPFSLEELAPNADARGMDQSGCSLVAAVALALANAKLKISGAARERTGLFVGTTNASPAAWEEFRSSAKERGLAKASAPAFTRLVLNASAGFATRVFGLRGPTTTLTTGRGSGLVALALGAAHLSTRSDLDRLVVAAVDEADLARAPEHPDAAVALVLSTERTEGAVRLERWALGGQRDDTSERVVPAIAGGSLLEVALAFRDSARPRRYVDASIACSAEVLLG